MPRIRNRERKVSSTVLGKLNTHVQKNKIDPLSYTVYKTTQNELKRSGRTEIIKLLEENIGGKLHDSGLSNDFMDMISKAQAMKVKTDSETTSNEKASLQQWKQQSEKETYRMGEKYAQIKYHITDCFPKHIENSYTSTAKNLITQF